MKKKIKLFLIIIAVLIIVILLIYCKIIKDGGIGIKGKNPTPIRLDGKENISSLSYSHTGTYIGDIYSYKIYNEKEKVKLKVEFMNINEDNPDIVEIKEDTLDKIMELVKKYNVNKWNGYDKYATNVLDGSSFYMKIRLDNKKSIIFSGYNCEPNGYYKFYNDLMKLIGKDVKKIKMKYNL